MKKNIVKILTLTILLNNIYFSSNASTLNRYETLEGEVITLDDVEDGDITEIEIFGNTVQDPNNLEDIQSVGDLYVNDKGEAILDRQGRKQYKVDIGSSRHYYQNQLSNPDLSSHPFNNATVEGDWNILEWQVGDYRTVSKYAYSKETKGTLKGDKIYCRFDIVKLNDLTYNSSLFCHRGGGHSFSYMSGSEYNNLQVNKEYTHSTLITYQGADNYSDLCVTFGAYTRDIECEFKVKDIILINLTQLYGKGNEPTKEWCDEFIQFRDDNTVVYEPNNKTTLLLPCQLMKIGNVADRLYWDNEKGRYIVEKNISKKLIDSIYYAAHYSGEYNYGYHIRTINSSNDKNFNIAYNHNYIINGFKDIIYSYYSPSSDPWTFDKWGGLDLLIRFPREDRFSTVEKTLLYLAENDINIYFHNKVPELIETNITKRLKLTTYPEKTYIYTETANSIKPTLKVTIDIIEQISEEAVNNVISNPTSNNIALARMFVNMLPESLYKDQLQAQLNEIFSEDMVLEKQSATANLDVYIKSENILMMSLNTNTVTFEDYSGVEELELLDAINISINSSLPYQLNAYVVGDITNKNKDKTLDFDILNIRDGNEVEYKKFDSINNKLVLLDNITKGNNISHNIDLKLSGNKAHDADVYKTTIKLEAEQK